MTDLFEEGIFLPFVYVIIIGLVFGVLLGVTAWSVDHALGIDDKIAPVLEENKMLRERASMADDHHDPDVWVIDIG